MTIPFVPLAQAVGLMFWLYLNKYLLYCTIACQQFCVDVFWAVIK